MIWAGILIYDQRFLHMDDDDGIYFPSGDTCDMVNITVVSDIIIR